MAAIFQAKKAGYPLDMEGFWLSDKFRIRADRLNFWAFDKFRFILFSWTPFKKNSPSKLIKLADILPGHQIYRFFPPLLAL